MSDEPLEFEVDELVVERPLSWLMQIGEHRVWLPKSECELDGDTVSVPRWLAEEKALDVEDTKDLR